MQRGFGFQGFGFNRPNSGPLMARWWTTGAKLDADFANNRYFHNGRVWGDETAFLNAVSGSKSGITRTIGPFVDPTGTNRVTNGTFTTDTTGWSAINSASIAGVSNELELTTPGGVNFGGFVFTAGVPNINGRAFRLQGTGRRGTNGNNFYPRLGTTSTLSAGPLSDPPFNSTSATVRTAYLSANANPVYPGVRASSNAAGTAYFDDFSLVEVWPFQGWTQGAVAFAILGRTPATIAADEVLFNAGDACGSGTASEDHIQVIRRVSDKHLLVNVVVGMGTQAALDLGVVADDTDFQIAASIAPSNFSASLNGGAPVTDVSGACPGCSMMWIGRSYIGNTWTGTIERVTVF